MCSNKSIILFGVQQQCITVGQALIDAGYNVAGVVTVVQRADYAGQVDVCSWALGLKLPTYVVDDYTLKDNSGFRMFRREIFNFSFLI